MIKTKMHILMGTFKENMYPSVCVEALDNLGISSNKIFTKFQFFFNFILLKHHISKQKTNKRILVP